MSLDDVNKEDKFDFTAEGEALGYIGLDQARVKAIEYARDNTEFYGPTYEGLRLVWQVLSADEGEDFYDIKLSFRPSGRFRGEPGIEEFIMTKLGEIRIRQILDEPEIEVSTPVAAEPELTDVNQIPSLTSADSTPTVVPATPSPAPEPSPPSEFQFVRKLQSPNPDDFSIPQSIAFDANGNVYVTVAHGVHKFDSDGRHILAWGSEGSGDGQFGIRLTIAVDQATVYVADRSNHRVQVFNTHGQFLRKWGTEGDDNGQFSLPSDIAVDLDGDVYVVDWRRRRDKLQVFDGNGRFLRKWGAVGSGTGHLGNPMGVTLDRTGNVYVTDTSYVAVQVFSNDGNFLRGWGGEGPSFGGGSSRDGLFNDPVGIAVDVAGYIYVPDKKNYRVQVFDGSGQFLTKWGSKGDGEGQFQTLEGIAVDVSGNVYVAGQNTAVQIFAPVPQR